MDDSQKAFMGTGWAFPFSVKTSSGGVKKAQYETDIEQSVSIILGTAKGERVMQPEFGCGIHDMVFDVISRSLLTNIEQTVFDALRDFEARIDVDEVSVDASDAFNGKLLIELEYTVRATNQPGNFVYPFYFKEAL